MHSDFIISHGLYENKENRYKWKVCSKFLNISCTYHECRCRIPIEFDWKMCDGGKAVPTNIRWMPKAIVWHSYPIH